LGVFATNIPFVAKKLTLSFFVTSLTKRAIINARSLYTFLTSTTLLNTESTYAFLTRRTIIFTRVINAYLTIVTSITRLANS
jgi:hypothetical protein